MKIIRTTDMFDAWFTGLTDRTGKFRIQARIDRAEMGNFGDCEPVGDKSTQSKDIKTALKLAREL